MCRIDAEFGNLHLDEKSDPLERFIQALDENAIREPIRALLTKHFAADWPHIFRSVDQLEETLARARGKLRHRTKLLRCSLLGHWQTD